MRFAVCIKQNISRLDVSVQNAVFMCVVHSASHFHDEFHCLPHRCRPATDYFVELASFDKSHAEVACAIALADLVDGNDLRMIELRRGFRFPAKAFQMGVGCPLTDANDLYRDGAVETPLPGAEYYALTAPTDFLQQFVITKLSEQLCCGSSFVAMGPSIRIPRSDIFNRHAAIKVKSRPNLKPADSRNDGFPAVELKRTAAQARPSLCDASQTFPFTNQLSGVSITP
jgi:hypothetical protein